jgi:hypothetical protein
MVMKLREKNPSKDLTAGFRRSRAAIVEDLEAASNNSVEWPHLAANGREGSEF